MYSFICIFIFKGRERGIEKVGGARREHVRDRVVGEEYKG